VEVPLDAGPWGAPVGADGEPSLSETLASFSALGAVQLRISQRRDVRPWEKGFKWAETDRHATLVLGKLLAELRDLCARKNVPLLVTRFSTGRTNAFEG